MRTESLLMIACRGLGNLNRQCRKPRIYNGFTTAIAHIADVHAGNILVMPGPTIGHDYALEYGVDRLELHEGQVPRGARVLLVDDVLATGGTAVAAVTLLEKAGRSVGRALFVAELDGLGGAGRLLDAGVEPVSLLHYPA